MNPGELNNEVIITTTTMTTVAGRTATSTSTQTVYMKVTQIDGARYFKEGESIDREVYRFEGWDNSFSNNITLTYNGLTLAPIVPIKRVKGTSNLSEVTIIAAVKR